MLENRTEPMQEQTWWKLHCASCLLVFCAVVWCCWCWLRSEWGKKTIQTYPYSNCTFHHQSSQRKQTSLTVPTDLGKTLANIICCMCLFQHFGKQDRTHTRTSMVKIALRKLFAGILCVCVVLLVLVVKWISKNNPNTFIFELHFHHQNSQRKQTSFKVPANLIENFDQHNLLYVSLSACWKTGQNPCKKHTWWRLHCASCLLVFCAVVWCCWLLLRSEWWKKIQTYPYSNCTFHHRNSQEYKQVLTYRPTSWKPWPPRLLYAFLSPRSKTGQDPCKNKYGQNCIAQVVCWYFVRLCGAAGVGCEVSDEKKNIQTYPYSNCTFHHQSSQRKQTSFKVPANLGKTLANIICCMCLFQHVGKQDRTHARTSMVKIALRKLFASILCGCVVLLVLVAKWVREKNHPNLSIF